MNFQGEIFLTLHLFSHSLNNFSYISTLYTTLCQIVDDEQYNNYIEKGNAVSKSVCAETRLHGF